MIKVNNLIVEQGIFPDGTPLMHLSIDRMSNVIIHWRYDNMGELFNLYCIVKKIRSDQGKNILIELYLPYCPNARQDRVKNFCDMFTLKYFAEIINSMNFYRVYISDPHSNVCMALINNTDSNVGDTHLKFKIDKLLADLKIDLLFYPDDGASKKYSDILLGRPFAYGRKTRDWSTGKITDLEIIGDVKGKNILFVDDIISYGGSLYYSAQKLKRLGANNIYAYITHTENSFIDKDKGRAKDVLGTLVEELYTTNSIYRGDHPLINVSEAI